MLLPPTPALCRYVIDAEGQTLGRVASLAAYYIRGKHMVTYSPSMDMGGYGELAGSPWGAGLGCGLVGSGRWVLASLESPSMDMGGYMVS